MSFGCKYTKLSILNRNFCQKLAIQNGKFLIFIVSVTDEIIILQNS